MNALSELTALRIEFVSVTVAFDRTTIQGRLLLHPVSAFAEFERGVLIEQTRAGLDAARRHGARIGRPPAKVDVRRMGELRAAGKSLREISKALEVATTTIHRLVNGHNGAAGEADGSKAPGGDPEEGLPKRSTPTPAQPAVLTAVG